jgi:release factor glutamine methyltransferase
MPGDRRITHDVSHVGPGATIKALLTAQATDVASLDRELLLAHATGRDRSFLRAHPEYVPHAAEAVHYRALVDRRADGEPLAYLTGHREFWGLRLTVTPAVLVPRPETELLVELAVARLSSGCRILDLGTGTGAIALALAAERPDCEIWALDRAEDALRVAHRNAQRLALDVHLVAGDWLEAIRGPFHVIVSNPPYVAAADPALEVSVAAHEPHAALHAGPDGLDALRTIIADAPLALGDDGWLIVEHGYAQGAAVRALMQSRGFGDIETHRDLAELERATLACWRPDR